MSAISSTLADKREALESRYKVPLHGKPLCNYLLFQRYNLTPSFEMSLFFNQLRTRGTLKPGSKLSLRCSQFLMLVVSFYAVLKIVLLRPRVLIYGSDKISSGGKDHDSRLESVYAHLRRHHVHFIEILHTTAGEEFLPHLRSRARAALYLEAIDLIFSFVRFLHLVHISRVQGADPFAEAHFYKLDRAAFRYFTFRLILRCSGARVLYAMDDVRNPELVLAARARHIPSVFFQHGHYTKYHLGFLAREWLEGEYIYPDRLYVWSEYWKEELKRLGSYIPASNIFVGGVPLPATTNSPERENNLQTVLIPYETVAPKGEVAEYVRAILKDPNSRVLFKVRKDMSKEAQLEEYGLLPHERLHAISDVPASESISVVAGTYSTFLYDMIARRLPVVLLQTSSDYGEGMVVNGLAERATLGDLSDVLQRAAALTPEEREERFEKLFGKEQVLLEDALTAFERELGIIS